MIVQTSGIAPGSVSLRVEHPSFLFRDFSPLEVVSGTLLPLGRIELQRGSTLERTLFNEKGKAMSAGTIEIVRPDGRMEVLQVGEEGRSRETGLRSGDRAALGR